MRIGLVQLEVELANPRKNLQRATNAVEQAAGSGAELVLLPEFFTSGMAFDPRILDVPDFQFQTTSTLLELASNLGIVVGGSFLTFNGAQAHNTFQLAMPDGQTFSHRKDIPTMVENAFYVGGDDDGVLDTPIGRIGVALCWEMLRWQTVTRMAGRIDFALAATCWWGPCLSPDGTEATDIPAKNLQMLCDAPSDLARLLGVPVAHSSVVGRYRAKRIHKRSDPVDGCFLGHSQLVAPDGTAVASCGHEPRTAVVVNDLPEAGTPSSTDIPCGEFWIPNLPEPHRKAWTRDADLGRAFYRGVALPHYGKSYGTVPEQAGMSNE